MTELAAAMSDAPVILDGGLATLLEARGHDLGSTLWSARLLLDDPAAITAAHAEFYAAGAQVAITATYQAALPALEDLGLSRSAAAGVLRAGVRAAQRAREQTADPDHRWVAASIGPYGAALADGSEYRGDYGLTAAQLRDWHAPRWEILAASGVDVLAMETIPCLAEVEALCALVTGTGVSAWLSVTAAGGRTRFGEPIQDAFAAAADVPEILAVGINCCAAAEVPDLVALAAELTGKPVVAYPNSGETWDEHARRWIGNSSFHPAAARSWVAAGAGLVGGCCRVGPAAISELAAAVRQG